MKLLLLLFEINYKLFLIYKKIFNSNIRKIIIIL